MAYAAYKIRIIANACITRYDNGEGSIEDIVASYNMTNENKALVEAEITLKQPDLTFE